MLNDQAGIPKNLRARIVAGSAILLSGSTLATVFSFAYNVAVARFLGPNGYGHATAIYTVLTIISAVTLSFQLIAAKLVAQQPTEAGKSSVYRELHRNSWACGILAGVVLLAFRQQITVYLNLPSPVLVELLSIAVAFYIPLGTRRGYIQGAFGFRGLATNMVLEAAIRLGGSLLMILLGTGVTGVIAANAAASVGAYLAIIPKLTSAAGSALRFWDGTREMLQALVFFSGQMLITNCDIVLVKHFFLPAIAGLYAAIAMVGRVIFTFSTAVVNSMFPVVAGSHKDERKNLSLIATSLLLVLVIEGVMVLGVRITPSWVWTSFFGKGFQMHGHESLQSLMALYALKTVIYSLSVVVISYEMSYKIANTSWVQLLFSGAVIAGICRFQGSLHEVIMVQLVLMVVLLVVVSVPFVIGAMRHDEEKAEASARGVRLIRRSSEDEAIAAFLKNDFEDEAYSAYHELLRPIVEFPNLADRLENAKRRGLLYLRQFPLWKEFPRDTQWYEIEVRESDLAQIRVFPRAQWRRVAGGNFDLTGIVEKMRQQLANDPFPAKIAAIRGRLGADDAMPATVLMIGTNESEPLTIIDGNHRLVAAVMAGKVDRLRYLCGLSPKMGNCCWYQTNFLTLLRYAANLLRYLLRDHDAILMQLIEGAHIDPLLSGNSQFPHDGPGMTAMEDSLQPAQKA